MCEKKTLKLLEHMGDYFYDNGIGNDLLNKI